MFYGPETGPLDQFMGWGGIFYYFWVIPAGA